MRGPFSKELLLQSGMLQQQTECIAIIYKHLGVLMTPAHLYWLLGQIRTVLDLGQDHNRSMRALLQRTTSSELEGHSNKPNVWQWSNSIWEEVLFLYVRLQTGRIMVWWCLSIRPSGSPSVRLSVRPSGSPSASFPHFSPTCFDILSCNFAHNFVLLYYRSSSSVVNLRQFLLELCPFWN